MFEDRQEVYFYYKDNFGFEHEARSIISPAYELGETQLGVVLEKFETFLLQCGFSINGKTLGFSEEEE